MKIKIFHNPRCKKSRAGLAYLQEKTQDFEIVYYLKDGISVETLEALFQMMGVSAREMIRTQEAYYKAELKTKTLTEEEYLAAISNHPKLLKRPLVVVGDRAVWADPPEKLDAIL
jgi:arsenate reductase (glutaredoxin)